MKPAEQNAAMAELEGWRMKHATQKKHLRRLRKALIDAERPQTIRAIVEKRIAYAVECGIRSVTEDIVGWPSLEDMVQGNAKNLIRELQKLGIQL